MKKAAFLSALFLGAMASAQVSTPTKLGGVDGVLKLVGCFADSGKVRCDLTFTAKDNFSTDFYIGMVGYVDSQGQKHNASRFKVGGQEWSTYNYSDTTKGIADIPLNLSYMIDAKPNSPLRYLVIDGAKFANVPVMNAAAPNKGLPNTSAANSVNIKTTSFDISLSGCTQTGATYTCSKATLTPKK